MMTTNSKTPEGSHRITSSRKLSECLDWQGLYLQAIVLIGCWSYSVALHWSNDGLWFPGDSPRHALNGIFWRDLAHEGLTDPVGFTKSYYARYPAITPTRYPPVFYISEAIAFECFGNSPYVAKGVVQFFGLIAGSYLLVGMRRWISPALGIVAGLLPLMPGMILWSNAVMPNVPAMTFALAALYHVRRGIESADRTAAIRQLCLALLLGALSVATHPTTGYTAFVALAWITMSGKGKLLLDRKIVFTAIGMLITLFSMYGAMKLIGSEQFVKADLRFSRFYRWPAAGFYFSVLPTIVGWWGIGAGTLGLILAWLDDRLRVEARRFAIATAITYVAMTPVWALDERYILLACPAFVAFTGICFLRLSVLAHSRFGSASLPMILGGGFITMTSLSIFDARNRSIENLADFEQLVETIEQLAPREAIIYDGWFHGNFIFYMRKRDPDFQRQVIRIRKQIEVVNTDQGFPISVEPKEGMTAQTIRELIHSTQCRWLILEVRHETQGNRTDELLQEVVKGSDFELVKSLQIHPKHIKSIAIFKAKPSQAKSTSNTGGSDVPIPVNGKNWYPIKH